MEDYYTEENMKDSKWIVSPSRRFQLLIRTYSTEKGCWDYSRGTVYRLEDYGLENPICDIKRNYSSFYHSFVEKDGQEWLITGRSYMSQTIVCLDTGEEFEPEGNQKNGFAFCWADAKLSPDGNTLVVDGCHWACPYEYKFFDFTDPRKGWPQLDHQYFEASDETGFEFNEDGTITISTSRKLYLPLNKYDEDLTSEEISELDEVEYDDDNNFRDVEHVRITVRREGNELVEVSKWLSEEEQERIEEDRIANEKYNAWLKEFKSSDPMYLDYQNLLKSKHLSPEDHESQGYCHRNWGPEGREEGGKRWCRRIVTKGKYTIDLNWAVEDGLVKLTIYKDGDKKEDKFFGNGIDALRSAFIHAELLVRGG